jgi:hypothetical protein
MILVQRLGDTRTFSIPLRWGNRPFIPGNDWHLVFTAKYDPQYSDPAAPIQLELGDGLTANNHFASVSLTRDLTVDLDAATLYWDIQAESYESEEVRTVRTGTLTLLREVTHGRKSPITAALTFAGANPNINFIQTAFAGTNNDVILSRLGALQLVITAAPSVNPTPTTAGYADSVLTIGIGSPGGSVPGTMTASELINLAVAVLPSPFTASFAPGNNGTGNVVPGTYNFTPPPVGTRIGQTLTVIDTGTLYIWTGSTWAELALA